MLMPSYEEEEGDLLWNAIEQRKHAQNAAATPGVVSSSADPADQVGLFAVIHTLQDVLQEETTSEAGRIEARTQLVEAIRGPRKPAETTTAKPPRRRLVWPDLSGRRQLVLAIVLLLLAVAAVGYSLLTAYQRACESTQKQSSSRPVSRLLLPTLSAPLSCETAELLPTPDPACSTVRLSDSSNLTAKRCH